MGTEEQAETMEVEGRANEKKGKAWGRRAWMVPSNPSGSLYPAMVQPRRKIGSE